MPELTEEMYCHQQICIPPTFPYLLRQYAKAAIRSQPTDLLKWSTAYFRCLSLNIPPPIKPRLEYPIPRDYVGVTPGWLRALNYQLQNSLTVSFKILWDRWIGACMEHEVLIKILCLGGFTDPGAIPWNRFLGLCAGHLTDNLTQTMILFCEIITEEPEGGSAMIPLEPFLDVYKFLAAIDASQPQTLLNLYFTDSALGLYTKTKKKAVKEVESESTPSAASSAQSVEEAVEETPPQMEIAGEGSIISCPDIITDDALREPELDEDKKSEKSEELLTLKRPDDDDIRDDDDSMAKPLADGEDKVKESVSALETFSRQPDDSAISVDQSAIKIEDGEEGDGGEADEGKVTEKKYHDDDDDDELEETKEIKDEEELKEEADADAEQANIETVRETRRKSIVENQLKQVEKDIFEKGGLELEEDSNEDLHEEEKLVTEEVADATCKVETDASGEGRSYAEIDELEEHIRIKYQEVEVGRGEVGREQLAEEEEEEAPEEVMVDAIPGIGPIVPLELVNAVERHLTAVAAEEHGMTMPRHVRHYSCPPLEVV